MPFNKELSKLKDIYAEVVDKIPLSNVDMGNPQQIYTACVYATILEIAKGSFVLAENNQTIILPILLRSMFEAYADFLNLIKEPDYFKKMYATFQKQKLSLIKSAISNKSNPFLNDTTEELDLGTEKQQLEEELKELNKEGNNPISVWDKFKDAGLRDQYQSIYWSLCLKTHNNVNALEDRHLDSNHDNPKLVIFKEDSIENYGHYLNLVEVVICNSTLEIHKMLGTGKKFNFDS